MGATQNTIGPARLPRAVTWTAFFLLFTAIAVLSFSYRYLDDLSRGHTGTLPHRLLEEATGVYSVLLLLPLTFRFARVYLFEKKGWVRLVGKHLLGAIAFSAAHTTIMALSRHFLFPFAGQGPYDYGIMLYRYPMEFSNDLIFYTAFVTVFYFFERLRMAQAQQLAAAELESKLAQAQLENLRLQLQPHFLFNTLNTISSVMYEDIRAADAMIDQLSDLLRLTLRASRSHEIPLSEELQITRLYLDLMQKRFENKIHITYSIDPALENVLVPQLILQPLVENSLRHGMRPGSAEIDLSIAAQRDNGTVILQVLDTGSGLATKNPAEVFGRGVGLANIRDRLAQLYGEHQQFAIANRSEGGAEVTLRVPYRAAAHSLESPPE